MHARDDAQPVIMIKSVQKRFRGLEKKYEHVRCDVKVKIRDAEKRVCVGEGMQVTKANET